MCVGSQSCQPQAIAEALGLRATVSTQGTKRIAQLERLVDRGRVANEEDVHVPSVSQVARRCRMRVAS